MKAKGYFERALKGLNWALCGLIISSILIVVYVYNVDPASITVGDPYTPVTVKTLFGEKTIYPRITETPKIYNYLNWWGYIGMAVLVIVNFPAIKKDLTKAVKKFERLEDELKKTEQEDREEQKKNKG